MDVILRELRAAECGFVKRGDERHERKAQQAGKENLRQPRHVRVETERHLKKVHQRSQRRGILEHPEQRPEFFRRDIFGICEQR